MKTLTKIFLPVLMIFIGINANAQNWLTVGNSTAAPNNVLGTTNSTSLDIRTNGTTRMFIKNTNGFIGIGTSTPGYILDIQNSGNASMNFKSATGNANILIDRGASGNSASVNYRTAGSASWQTGNLNDNNFSINNVGVSTSMTILKTNNFVGIGTVNPFFKLDVKGGSVNTDSQYMISGAQVLKRFTGNTIQIGDTSANVSIGASESPFSPYFRLQVEGSPASAPSAILFARNNWLGTGTDVIGVFGASNPAAGFGVGVQGDGGYKGVVGNSTGATGNTGGNFGVLGNTSGEATESYGVFGSAQSNGINYGIYGQADFGTTNWAGYFSGSTFCTGTYQSSDRKLKTNIQDFTNALNILENLNPKTYNFKTDEYKGLHLPAGERYGLIADEFETVLPQLVKTASQPLNPPGKDHPKNEEMILFKSVNYTELIPILIQGIKEQQTQIKQQQSDISSLKNELDNLKNNIAVNANKNETSKSTVAMQEAFLKQNTPNPFSDETTIGYYIPASSVSASICVINTSGIVLKTISIKEKGNGEVKINFTGFASENLSYQLWVDGKMIDSKMMLKSK